MRTGSSQRGFTLVEAVIVIVITGIIAAVVAVFIRTPVDSYFDSVARAELSDAADTALRRMSRDLRLALPNSIRVNGTFIELLLTSDGGRYLDESDNLATGNQILDFTNSTNRTFNIVGFAMPSIQPGNSVVVYNLGIPPADAYCVSTTACNNRAVVESVTPDSVTLVANPFPNGALRSPGNRFQVVTTPVTYGCANGVLTRYWGYPVSATQGTPPSGDNMQSAVLAKGAACNFSYVNQANVRAGLVGLSITMTGEGNAGTVTLFQQVHVDNTP
jgi:MSHA biogenesis protein MshO